MRLRPFVWLKRVLPEPVVRAFSGFWAMPLGFGVVGGATAVAWQFAPKASLIWLLPEEAARIDPEGARTILSVVATSVMSLVSIVLSLTFVALSLNAQLLSPRMLDAVLRERAAQVLLGLALATFLFASISLSISGEEALWRLLLAAPAALVLATATLVTTVVFIHRMTLVMRPDEMVAQRASAFLAAARKVSSPPANCITGSQEQAGELDRALADAEPLRVDRAGYVGGIDWPEMVALARECDVRLAIGVLENQFMTPGAVFGRANAMTAESLSRAVAALNLTDRRARGNSVAYEAQSISEGAIRALSPGINDPGTALSCIDRLFEGAFLLAGAPPPVALAGSDGHACVLRATYGVPELLEQAIRPILFYVHEDPRIPQRMRTLAEALEPDLTDDRGREALKKLERQIDACMEAV